MIEPKTGPTAGSGVTRWCSAERLTRCTAYLGHASRRENGFYFVIASQRVRPEVAGPMTGSAKQSSATPGLDCFVAEPATDLIRWLLAMTSSSCRI